MQRSFSHHERKRFSKDFPEGAAAFDRHKTMYKMIIELSGKSALDA
jgi:hypothetical protein